MTFTVKDVLSIQVAPALGCTEPVAIALGAASAMSLLPTDDFDTLEVAVDPNVYKNGLAVSIPGANGLCGLDTAAALGAVGGDPALRLEVLQTVTDAHVTAAKAALAAKKVTVTLLTDHRGLLIRTRAISGSNTAESVIEGLHDNIVSLTLNGKPVDSPLIKGRTEGGPSPVAAMEAWLKTLTLNELVGLTDELDDDDFAFIREGVDVNMRLAEQGLKYGLGLGVGKTLERLSRQGLIKKDMMLAARILASAAADARMSGASLPAMSSAGSGNHGLTAILPIWAVKDYVEGIEPKAVLEAIALSHIVTAFVKAHTGRLSAICGCSVAAGAGATAGITFLLGGDAKHIAGAIKNLLEDLAGIICDGAKTGCALKLATAAGTAVQAALFSLQGVNVHHTDGIIGLSSEDTMRNVGTLAVDGMIQTDQTILQIMLKKRFNDV
ncbi:MULTISPECIES: L-serine ammonia-lyase, iron-sulfur-dependent, subunit alpha [unclassified Pseudodesulfovibrio]|uniref:L-cysteine desulfidase family protein n=1 Tax=unclassified Pseudodesulfovibrio TaxID=2661612 RepID=UPI000FEBDC57|nr:MULTISPECIES: L-serine ammonia-lyase, iron-sulfur-dependent, subunit alpha [unclassified Pseudodesulfovibrio]MCJ2163145.1 L-serine ammonia-lyase, iron-sulfur-dependent, subunit alpha [Pseudodesulfovibrio sp. S3-i]RWU07136.1 serine dehydratase subunit alpha family protein [Pseudodesulfovibrio sp. S3]